LTIFGVGVVCGGFSLISSSGKVCGLNLIIRKSCIVCPYASGGLLADLDCKQLFCSIAAVLLLVLLRFVVIDLGVLVSDAPDLKDTTAILFRGMGCPVEEIGRLVNCELEL
jgi:hypothetical protein